MSDPAIRGPGPADAEILAANNRVMAAETEGRILDSAVALAGVRSVLADPGKAEYRIAERNGEVVGQLMLTQEWSDWRDGRFWWIQSVYVKPEHRGTGVYKALYEDVLHRARKAADVVGIRLYVEKGNRLARAVYESLGMAEEPYAMYETALTRSGAGRADSPSG